MDSELCAWEYERHHYCVVYHGQDQNTFYYSDGTGPLSDDALEDITDGQPTKPISHIEDDDSVLHLMYRIGLEEDLRKEYMYLWIESPEGPVNVAFDLTFKLNKKTARNFDYDIIPDPESEFREKISNEADWSAKVSVHNFKSSLMSSYTYPNDDLRVIHCYPFDSFVSNMAERNDYFFLIQTYYPEVSVEADLADIRLTTAIPGKESMDDVQQIIGGANRALTLVNSPVHNEQALTYNETHDNPVVFGDGEGNGICNILEAIIHVNYNEQNDEFVNLSKIFHMVNTNKDMPFARFYMDGDKAPKFKVYSELTDQKSPLFTKREIIQDWINPRLKRLDKTNIHAVQVAQFKQVGNKGLSFKFLRPGQDSTDERKYFTLNIHRNGRLDIKCHWEEHYGPAESPAGTPDLVVEAIEIITRFINHLNELQFHVPSSRKKKITPPDPNIGHQDNVNTHVAFFNTITTFDFGELIDREDFMQYLKQYAMSHIVPVHRETISGEDTRSFEFRYKRIHNYIHIKSIFRTIKQFKDRVKKGPSAKKDASKKDVIKHITHVYNLTEANARRMVDAYEEQYEMENHNKGRGRKVGITANQIMSLIGRSVEKKMGIDIKILKRDLKRPHDTKYKCLILGVDRDLLGPIVHFVKYALLYYKHRDNLVEDDPLFALDGAIADRLVEEDREGPAVEAIQNKTAEEVMEKRKKVKSAHLGADSDSDSDSDDSEDEDDPDDMPLDDASEETATAPPPPAKKPQKKVNVKARSMLEILQDTFDIYKDVKYSKGCQKADGRQPLVVEPETEAVLKEYVDRTIAEVTDKMNDASEEDLPDLKLHLRELEIHKKTLDNGAIYNGKFFFCPLTWDHMSSSAGWAVNFPRLQTALENKGKYYVPPIARWRENNWTERVGTNQHARALDTSDKMPPHHWYMSFLSGITQAGNGNAANSTCLACCFKTTNKRKRREECLTQGEKVAAGTKASTQAYILHENRTQLNKDRFARIPAKIDPIFNRRQEGFKVVSGTIEPGFDFYLRKGVKPGNWFLNAINEIIPQHKDLIAHIEDFLLENPDDDPMETFKSLKRGAIHHLFRLSEENPMDDDDMELDDGTFEDRFEDMLPLLRFIQYMKNRRNEINEDFLWDLLSAPGMILPGGLNIIICDVRTGSKRSKTIEMGVVKCPVGFETTTLYKEDRETIVLYKYGMTYEIICHVQADERKNIITKRLFEPGHPLIKEIMKYIGSQCLPIRNEHAKREHRKHVKNVSVTGDIMDRIFLTDAEPINMERAQILLREADNEGIKGYNIRGQMVDSYNKVTHLVFGKNTDNQGDEYTRMVPIHPSGVQLGQYDIIDGDKADHLYPTVHGFVRDAYMLSTYMNFVGYTPYAFLLDPGEDLDNPDDDIIIGVILGNGLITYTQPLPVVDIIGEEFDIVHPVTPELEPIHVRMESLLFADREDQWYDDYRAADQSLRRRNRHIADKRKIFAIRQAFEQETYQKLRYELTKLLAQKKYDDIIIELFAVLKLVEEKDIELEEARDVIYQQISSVLKDHVTLDPPVGLEEAVGPLDKGFDELSEEDLKGEYTYLRPFVRYECHNPNMDKYREGDVHCISKDDKYVLFVSDINLVTGDADNYLNYTQRIAEEILRIPLKRYEILNDEMDNFVSDYYIRHDDEHYIDATDNAELLEVIQKLYETGVDYTELMKAHYDVVNPAQHTAHDAEALADEMLNPCRGIFLNLPQFWVRQLGTLSWKIYHIEGSYDCIYKELDTIIAKRNSDYGLDEDVDTRKAVATLIDKSVDEHEGRQGWELALDHYKSYWRTAYRSIKTRTQLLDMVKHSEQHHISHLDLSLISRAYNIRFIALTRPEPGNPSSADGFVCIGTTQTTNNHKEGYPISYIILYHQGLTDYSIVKYIGESSEAKAYFEEAELPEAIHSKWVEICYNDVAETQDPANHLFQQAMYPKVSDTGHTYYVTKDGEKFPSLSHRSKRLFRAKPKPKTKATPKPKTKAKVKAKPVKAAVVDPDAADPGESVEPVDPVDLEEVDLGPPDIGAGIAKSEVKPRKRAVAVKRARAKAKPKAKPIPHQEPEVPEEIMKLVKKKVKAVAKKKVKAPPPPDQDQEQEQEQEQE